MKHTKGGDHKNQVSKHWKQWY